MNTTAFITQIAEHTHQPTTRTLDPWLASSASGRAAHLLTTPGGSDTWCQSTAPRPVGGRTTLLRCHGCYQALDQFLGQGAAQAYLTYLRSLRLNR